MFVKVLLLALAVSVHGTWNTGSLYGGNYGTYGSGLYGAGLGVSGIPVYRSSANYGSLYGANGWGYGANLGRVGGLGAVRTTGAIVGSGALGYGTGALLAGPATVGTTYGAGLGYGVGISGASHGLSGLNIARGVSVHQAGPVTAAVQTISRTVDYRPVPYSGEPATVQDVDVPPQESPIRINFQSKSSPLAVTQQHIPAEPAQVQVTQSEDEPQTAIHNVVRPVIQQVHETIQPYRSLTQQVEPVIEQTHTNIAQGEGVRLSGLTSGIVGGTGVLAASGVGIAQPAYATHAVAARPVGLGVVGGVTNWGYNGGLGLSGAKLGGYSTGLGLTGARIGGYYGGATTGLGYGKTYGSYGGYGLGSGLALNGLSGLSGGYGYGTAAKVIRY
ncbi:fibroin heavy chain-like [Oppia nitens]|uniref:fibroin heavy chain-like n=1 Tax=Oppia nitens TaxID=1686743 RepID=UPI0023DC8406|nr:fibroin heavy chain-like [Oppia nitens]